MGKSINTALAREWKKRKLKRMCETRSKDDVNVLLIGV